ncbi:hypothetical protein SHKM778_08160 [Streptomyces sp. KM77-8]|uniref:Uncharacterized protein n=1 Tax=Streptomyces haneummycinicus TaxID=3074435 RepID=A0AAT9HAK9_9ACTN
MAALPVYPWRLALDGYATCRQLRTQGLRPGGQDVAAQIERPAAGGGHWSPTSTASTSPSPSAP